MSIAAAYLVSEGVVFGTDSSSTISVHSSEGSQGVAQIFNYAQKIFEVGENSRIAVSTWGQGSFGKTSHRTIVARLSDKINDKTTVTQAAEMLAELGNSSFEQSAGDFVGYYIGGWDPGSHDPVCVMVELRPNEKPILKPLDIGMCSFSGFPNFFSRVFRGFDPDLKLSLRDEIKKRLSDGDMAKANFDRIYEEAFENAHRPLVAVGYQDLPIREAVDFVYSYLHITVKALKFKFGAPLCGGPIEIGFISTDRKFRWVRHKKFSVAISEQEREYDV